MSFPHWKYGRCTHMTMLRAVYVEQSHDVINILRASTLLELPRKQQFSVFAENLKKGLALHLDLCYNP